MSINSTIVHTWQALVVVKGEGRLRQVQATTRKKAMSKLQKQFNTKQVRNLKQIS